MKKREKRVIKPKCIICKKELKVAIVIPSRINNRNFEMLVKLSLPICEECKKREDYNKLNIGPKREGLAYRFVQWQNHLSNIQEIKNLLDTANKTENELHFTLSEITLILQNYTTVKIQVYWVTSDKAVISWEDKINKHKTIPVEYFLEAIKTVRPDRDKLTKNDLRNLFRQRKKINKTIKRLIMKNNGISLEIYVKDKKLNKNDYELICSALKEKKNILVGTKNDDERKELMTAIINKMIELVPDNPLGIIERKFPLKYKTDFYIKMESDASISKAISQIIKFGTNLFTLKKPTIICDTLNGDIEGTYELIKAWDFRITAGGIVGLNADSLENMTQVIVEDVLLNIKEKQLEHNFQGLNGKVDLCIYFDGNTISVSSISEQVEE